MNPQPWQNVWLIGGTLYLCDEGKELDRGETLRTMTNGKLGSQAKAEVDRGELLLI